MQRNKDQPRRQYEESQLFEESHCDLARLSWTERKLWGDSTANEGNCYFSEVWVGSAAATQPRHTAGIRRRCGASVLTGDRR